MAVGVVSRAVDTAPGAPDWIGNVMSPWLVTAWLAGTTARTSVRGVLAGVTALGAVVGAYLLLAGPDVARLWQILVPLAAVAGPLYGWAGRAWRSNGRRAEVGLALLGATLFLEGLLLQAGERSAAERIGFTLELLLGLGVLLLAARRPS